MSKINKKLPRLYELRDSILESIYNYSVSDFENDTEKTTIENEAEIIHNNELIGHVKFCVAINVLTKAFEGNYDYPPTAEEVEFELFSSSVVMMYSNKGLELPNITKSINDLLYKREGKILKF